MKFKNIKKKTYKKKSPSNSRSIPATFKIPFDFNLSLLKIDHIKFFKVYRRALKVFVLSIFIIAVIIVGFDFQNNLRENKKINSQREILTKELKFWKDFILKNQNYPDAYFQASILEYKLGDNSKAKMYVEKGLALDPNSESGKQIEQLLK
jgi:tetratricopeptide (TPR) repeat protein